LRSSWGWGQRHCVTGSSKPRSTAVSDQESRPMTRSGLLSWRRRFASSGEPTRDPQGGVGFLREGAPPSTAEVVSFINEHLERFGVEPICDTLQSPRLLITRRSPDHPRSGSCATGNSKPGALGCTKTTSTSMAPRNVWKQLRREDIEVGRDSVGRLMAELELAGAVRGKTWRPRFHPRLPHGRPTWFSRHG